MTQPKYSIVAAVMVKVYEPRDLLSGRTNDHLELHVLEAHGGTVILRCWGRTAKRMNAFLLVHNIYRFDIDDLDRVCGARRIPT